MISGSMNTSIVSIYERTHVKIERWTTFLTYFIYGLGLPIFILPTAIWSFHKYYTTGQSDESFSLVVPASWVPGITSEIFFRFLCRCCYRSRLPFDWKIPSGYLLAAFQQAISLYAYGTIFVVVPGLYFNCCLFSMVLPSDIEKCLRNLNTRIISNQTVLSRERRFESKIEFYKVIKFHCDADELSISFVFCWN